VARHPPTPVDWFLRRHAATVMWLLSFPLACSEGPAEPLPELRLEEWSLSPLPTKARFVAIRDMTLLGPDLWVLDGAPPFLTQISLETGEAVQFGRNGEGPGEYLAPWAVRPTTDSTGVLVWDFGARRVTRYDLSGRLVGSQAMSQEGQIRARSNFKEVSYADPFRVRSVPIGYLAGAFDRRLDLTADYSRGSIRLSKPNLDPGQQIVRLTDLVVPGVESMKEWAAVPVWDACGRELAVWKPATSSVLWINPKGIVHLEVAVDLPPLRIKPEDIEGYLEHMARLELGSDYRDRGIDFRRMAEQARDRFAEMRPLVTDLRCQGSGTAWLRLFSTQHDPLGRSSWWVQVGPDGLINKADSPAGFSPFLFRDEGHIGSYELPGGEQAIALASPPHAISLSDPH